MALKKLVTIAGLVLSVLVFAQPIQAGVNWLKYSYFNNVGGLNDHLAATEIKDNEASDLQNVVFDTPGAIKKRYGYTTIPNNPVAKVATGTTTAITGLTFYKKDNGDRYLVAICNSDSKATAMMKNYTAGFGPETGDWRNIDFLSLPSSYSNNYLPTFSVAQDRLIITTPSASGSYPYRWNGTGNVDYLTNDADCPKASINVYHKNHLVLSGNSDYPSRVWFSALDNIFSYDATDFLDVETSDGSKVRALVSAFDSLYIFKDKSIWRLSGTNKDDFVLQKMVDGIGTLSPVSPKVVNNYIYFTTAQNDIAIYDGAYTCKFISEKIRNTIGGLSFTRAPYTAGSAFSTYRYNDFDYYCAVSTSSATNNNKVLVFDTSLAAWSKFSGMNISAMCVGDDDSGKNALYFGDNSGYIHRYPSTTYQDGNVSTGAIVAYYQTKWFKYSEASLGDKYWRLIKTYSASEAPASSTTITLNVECKSDYETTGKFLTVDITQSTSKWDAAIWDDSNWTGASLVVGRKEVEKGTSMFQGNFSNNNLNEGFTLYGFENFIEPTDQI